MRKWLILTLIASSRICRAKNLTLLSWDSSKILSTVIHAYSLPLNWLRSWFAYCIWETQVRRLSKSFVSDRTIIDYRLSTYVSWVATREHGCDHWVESLCLRLVERRGEIEQYTPRVLSLERLLLGLLKFVLRKHLLSFNTLTANLCQCEWFDEFIIYIDYQKFGQIFNFS